MNHRIAGFAVLEQLPQGAAARELVQHIGATAGSVTISTCNRLEYFIDVDAKDSSWVITALLESLAETCNVGLPEINRAAEVFLGTEVPQHLFSLIAGLESAVVGDAEISGQVRSCFKEAQGEGTTSSALEFLFQHAGRSGRRIKNSSGIGAAGRSLVSLALDRVSKSLASPADTKIVMVGTGSYAGAIWKQLSTRGFRNIKILSPSGREWIFARSHDVIPVAWDKRRKELSSADLVITSTRGVKLEVADFGDYRTGKLPLTILDFGMPANISPAVAELPGIDHLDLAAVATDTPRPDRQATAAARRALSEEITAFESAAAEREAAKAIAAYRAHVGDLLADELERVSPAAHPGQVAPPRRAHDASGSHSGPATNSKGEAVSQNRGYPTTAGEGTDRALRHFAGKLTHETTTRIRDLAANGQLPQALEALRVMYGLDSELV